MAKKEKLMKSLYVIGEICGRASRGLIKAALVSFAVGAACHCTWDTLERKSNNKFNNKKR